MVLLRGKGFLDGHIGCYNNLEECNARLKNVNLPQFQNALQKSKIKNEIATFFILAFLRLFVTKVHLQF
jgi:hypothetical protein